MKTYARILSAMRATAQNSIERSALPAGVFTGLLATLMMASSAVHADDLDVYTKATAISSSTPTMAMIFDTSDVAANNLLVSSGEVATSLLHESSANMKDALRAMMTSGPDNLKISLSDYFRGGDGYDNGRILQEMVRIGDAASSTPGATTFTGNIDAHIVEGADDAAQGTSGGVRTGETAIEIPYKPSPGYTTAINGSWTSSAGAGLQGTCCDGTEDPVIVGSTTYANISNAGSGNRYYYYVPSAGSQTFSLDAAGGQATNTVLFLVDLSAYPYPIIAKNDDRGTTLGCPDGYSLVASGTNAGKCKNGPSIVNQSIIDQNSRITVSGLTVGNWYMLIAATRDAGKADTFTLVMSNPGNGQFYDVNSAWTPQNTGFRFQKLNIPQGATINSAKLVFRTVGGSGTPPTVQVGLDDSTSPASFVVKDINTRAVNYKSPEILNGGSPDVDVTSLVSSQVANSGWCPGNAMAFVVRPAGAITGDHVQVWSYEGSVTDSAQLVVDYDPDSGDPAACSQKTISLRISSMSEDTNQFADGTVDIDKAYMPKTSSDATIADQRGNLWISSNTKVGLRFSLAEIPIGATVTSAKLYLTARSGAVQPVKVSSILTGGIAQAFLPDINYLDSLALGSSIDWTPGSWTAGVEYEAVNAFGKDVTDLVSEQVKQDDWVNEGTLGFVLEGGGGASVMKACAWEYGPSGGFASILPEDFGSCAARLEVTYNTNGAAIETTYRKVLVDQMVALKKSGLQPMGAAYLKTAEYLGGYFAAMKTDGIDDGATCDTATPVTPTLVSGACSSNTIVFIANNNEGAKYDKSAYEAEVASFVNAVAPGSGTTCTVSGSGSNMSGKNCTTTVAAALFDDGDGGFTQLGDGGTKYSVKTYPINFGATAGGGGGGGGTTGGGTMRGIASSGGGEFYQSGSSGELVKQLLAIVTSVADQGAAVAAPGISVNALNRFEHLDQLYYSLFKPSTHIDWTGNLKRFQLLSSDVADVNNNKAVLTGTKGFFDTDAHSWWSGVVDGAVVTDGGAATESITDERRIFTYLGDNSDVSATTLDEMVGRTNSNLDEFVMGVDRLPEYFVSGGPLADQEKVDQRTLQVIDFLAAAPNNLRFWAAAIHASPRIVAFNSDPVKPILTVFYGDNRGFLHAVDGGELTSSDPTVNLANTGGKELFAFMPQELLKNAALFESNARSVLTDGYIYGMDGDMTLIRKDTDFNGDYDKVYLYAGLRRGGRNYYGLDVSGARSDVDEADRTPILQFVIEGGKTPYEELGQTWSAMSVNNIKFDGNRQQVLVFAGGHDEAIHDIDTANPSSTTDGKAFRDVEQLGRYVYMVDALSGKLLWSSKMMDVSKFPALAYMKYSMTATPRLYDRNADGMVDGMYVVDLAGQVFRFEFKLDNEGVDDLVSAVVRVATLGATTSGADPVLDNRRFYDSPSVAFVRNIDGTADVLLALSSGYREEPYDKTTNEMFVFLRDRGAFDSVAPANTTLTLADLENVSGTASATDLTKPGWYFYYDKVIGEKGIGSPVIFNNAILFASYVLELSANACVPDIGNTRLYLTDFSGQGLLVGLNRWKDIGLPGMADTPQVIFREGGGLDVAVGVKINDAAALCDGSVACPFDSSLFGKLQRGRWYIQDEE